MRRRALLAIPSLLGVVLLAACGPKALVLPTGTGTAVADARTPFEQASGLCRSVRTLTAQLRLSGRAGTQKMRGTVVAGFERPDRLRLEGVAPFGPPAFILVARDRVATLVLPRDERILTRESVPDILEALAGIRLDAAGLRALVSGCVVDAPESASARSFPDGWLAVDLVTHGPEAAATPSGVAYLRQEQGQWRIVAGRLGALQVEYQQFEGGRPHQVLLRSVADASPRGGVPVDLALTLSQLAVNVGLDDKAWQVASPPRGAPLTLDELRRAGPLGERNK